MKMVVEFTWNGKDLGQCWMNIDNLKILLYGKTHTNEKLLKVKEIKTSPKKNKELGKLIISASGLRRIANGLEEDYKTEGDVKVECFVTGLTCLPKDKTKTFAVKRKPNKFIKIKKTKKIKRS